MLVQPAPFDDGYDVGGSEVRRAGKESARITIAVVYRPTEGLRLCHSHTFSAGTRSLFGVTPQIIEVFRQLHDGIKACVRNNDRRCSEWSPR